MKIRRKIWSLPLALVTAMLVVGLFATAVLATSKPAVKVQIPDQTITIEAGAAAQVDNEAPEINLGDVDNDDTASPQNPPPASLGDDPAFEDGDDDFLVYTALTANQKVVGVRLTPVVRTESPTYNDGPTNADPSNGIAVIHTWWNGLSCEQKGDRLDFNHLELDSDDERIHLPFDGKGTEATDDDQLAAGNCRDYGALDDDDDSNADPPVTAGEDLQTDIIIALHWDMLSGSEMEKAAKAGGEGSRASNYKERWGALSAGERRNVEDWFSDDRKDGRILAMGIGPLVLSHLGIDNDETDTNNDDAADFPEDGIAGTATVYVKASDKDGRLVGISSGDGTVGQSFDVTANRTSLPADTNIPDLQSTSLTAEAVLRATAADDTYVFTTPGASSIDFEPADAGDADTAATDAYVTVRVSPGTQAGTEILSANLVSETDNLAAHHQLINFSITDGANVPFQVRKVDQVRNPNGTMTRVYDQAMVTVKSGTPALQPGASHSFVLGANEVGSTDPDRETEIEVRVEVVLDNVPPVFGATNPSTGTVVERAHETAIATFTATDANHQVLRYSIVLKDREAEDDSDAAETEFIQDENDRGGLIGASLDKDHFASTGVLRTKTKKAKGSASAQPKFYTAPDEDDEDTEYDETDSDFAPRNEYVFTVRVWDGTRYAEQDLEFTLTVTDSDDPDPRPGDNKRHAVSENNTGGPDHSFGEVAGLDDEEGNYSLGDQIDNKGNIVSPPTSADEEDETLFGIDKDTGELYLREEKAANPSKGDRGALDFESGVTQYILSVERGNKTVVVVIDVQDVNEAPRFSEAAKEMEEKGTKPVGQPTAEKGYVELYVLESAAVGTVVSIGQDAGGNPTSIAADYPATDEDDNAENPAWSDIIYDLWYDSDLTDRDNNKDDAFAGADAMFAVDSDGSITVNRELDPDADDAVRSIDLVLRAVDATQASEEAADTRAEGAPDLKDTLMIRVSIIDTNVAPVFDEPSREQTHAEVSEGAAVGTVVYTYRATDEDGDTVRYRLRDQDDAPFFTVEETTNAIGEEIGVLKTAAGLNYEVSTSHTVEIQAYDTDGDTDEIVIEVSVTNVNDEVPVFTAAPRLTIPVAENTPRGTVLANYAATDADGDTVTYSLEAGGNSKSFYIDSATGDLKTLESLDYDSNTPCPTTGCSVTIIASDGTHNAMHNGSEPSVTITVSPIEDSVSTLSVTKANPVPGTTMGDAMTALGNTKESVDARVPERPADLPNAYGAPMNFVDTDWANWGTVLRIEVTAQSPDANCGGGNECVVIRLNSDSADDTLKLQAYRMDTPAGAASNENKFVAAVMLVELDGDATDIKTSSNDDIPVYAHDDGSVARLQVDEEDEIEIEFYNLRGDVEVENETPEISNFAPEHESAFDDPDVEYTFTVTDSHSGLPEPEDLPDVDGDDAYMPAVALISKGQCETAGSDASAASKARRAKLIKDGFSIVEDMAGISDDGMLYCPGVGQDGEYDASGAGYGFAPIRDDKDFSDIDDGFDVETTIVLRENRIFYVTFVACDNAGNCSFFDPDGNDDAEELAEITVDTEDPVFVEARTGLTWDSTDNEYDDDRSFIQVIFNDLTKLNTETVEIADFVVEGHSIKDVHVFENPDSDDVDWGDSGRYGAAGSSNKRGIDRYRDIENVVFIELEDELLADETPDVTIVPNGVEDKAGNEQDDGDHEADDWISPKFTIVSIVSTRVTSQDQILAGDDDEVTVVVTSDERLDSTRPTVTVTYVNAPAGSIDTKGTATCDTDDGDDEGTRERGEIANSEDCADNGAATGGTLNNSVEKVSNTEWIVTITEPKDTGYYNFRISGDDRSSQKNPGSEGVSPGSIVTDFFDADGDVNVDDAIFFEGDINLPKPQVRVSGVSVEDNEADVEFRSPLFVELDFAANHSDNCRNVDNDERMSNCMNENSEYAEDNFDDIVVTSFMLDGVDLTDSVKTTDNQSFLVSLESISIGDHTATVQAVDQAGNVFEDTLEIDFEVNDRDPFEKRLSPGWNLVSLPGEPGDSSIAAVFGPGVEVRTVYSYDPVIPGGWMVAVRETLDSDWQGDLTEITGQRVLLFSINVTVNCSA